MSPTPTTQTSLHSYSPTRHARAEAARGLLAVDGAGGGVVKPTPITEADLDKIESLAQANAAETYRGALLALVDEVRRLRGIVLEGAQRSADRVEVLR